ncbi:GATA transcription factor 23-like [Panicum miliaceum]|uniref:GATA transcription factor 23-like n=1 Tax=Panicum miliaceum TaxID=4540 RepID=A0A3L6QYE6_PANMI|nr:GATA transcription factor 23-like [Panicum miliaceum]
MASADHSEVHPSSLVSSPCRRVLRSSCRPRLRFMFAADRRDRGGGERREELRRMPRHHHAHVAQRPDRAQGELFLATVLSTKPMSLCNACGIRYRKKRRQELGLDHKQQQQQRSQHNGEATTEVKDSSSSSSGSSNLQAVQKRRLLMGVEEAALLLMTLSSSPTSTLLHG